MLALLFGAIVIAVCCVIILIFRILDSSPGNEETIRLSEMIQKGAKSFLFQEYAIFFPIIFVIALLIFIFLNWICAISFIAGAVFSSLAGFFGMIIATKSNARTSWGAIKGLPSALKIAFSGGAVMGISVSTLGLLGIGLIYKLTRNVEYISYYSLGASFVALFARVGGGIYTKAADVGADIVGKTEANLPEDDPRNPAVIADNVGDNVGDVAGMGADLYESYVGSIFSALALATIIDARFTDAIFALVTFGLLSSIASVVITLTAGKKFRDPSSALRFGTILSSVLVAACMFVYSMVINLYNIFFVVILGIFVGVVVGFVTEFYTSGKKVINLAKSATMGPANSMINGISLGMESTSVVTVLIVLVVLISFRLLGLFGVALSAVGMLSTIGMSLSVDAYGPIADNAGGIAQMAGLDSKVREITDKLDSVGNTTAAMGKGFAITSAALTSLALFSNYANVAHVSTLDIKDPTLFTGAMIGAMLPFLFSALTMKAVGSTADIMVEEIRRQIKEVPGIISGQVQPDYNRCIQIATKGALKRMVFPSLLAVISPVMTYFVLGPSGTAGILIGSTVSGVMLAIFMANSGGAWDNAKKYVEEGHYGGKGSLTHKATVIGDTVGDPLKDTAGPSINILIKLMAITSVVTAIFVGR